MADCSPEEIGRWKQYYEIIRQEIKRLSILTEKLRLLFHLERADEPVIREPVNMRSVMDDVIMAQAERASQENISLKYQGPNRPAKVLGNRENLYQLMNNLVGNSIKYSKESGGEVIISLNEVGSIIQLAVSDNGIGIPQEELPFVFDTAYRSQNKTSVSRPGSGLGLAIVKRIIEQYEGHVGIDSIFGEGTKITIDLPIYNPSHYE